MRNSDSLIGIETIARARRIHSGLMHERARLGVLTSLLAHPKGLSFAAIKQLCGLTDGNLARHLAVLESAKLIENRKIAEDARSQTLCRITPEGRKRFVAYLSELERVLLDAGATAESENRLLQRP